MIIIIIIIIKIKRVEFVIVIPNPKVVEEEGIPSLTNVFAQSFDFVCFFLFNFSTKFI